MSEKLQKVLARSGLGSRREMERWILAGRVKVNGQCATLGQRVLPDDEIDVDGHCIYPPDISSAQNHKLMIYYKPVGEVCTRKDPQGRTTVFSRFPKLTSGRWILVGRLDMNTAGLLLVTTHGEWAHQLMHPSANIEREYCVDVVGQITQSMLNNMRRGVMLEDGVSKFLSINKSDNTKAVNQYKVTLTRGRYREVRRLWASQGVSVNRLTRIRFGHIYLPAALKPGQWSMLSYQDILKILPDQKNTH